MPSSTSSSKPLALFIGLAIFAGSEWALWTSATLARLLLRYQPAAASGDSLGVASRIRLIEPDGGLLVLLGSSQVREGLDCGILTGSSSATRCVNLGIGGGAPLDMLHISRELGDRPRTVIISLFPGSISKAPKSGFIDSETLRAVVTGVGFAKITTGDWRLMGSGLLQTLSPTLRHREGLRDAFWEAARAWPERPDQGRATTVRRTTDDDRKPPQYFTNRIGRADPDFALSRFTAAQELALQLLIAREVGAGHRVVVADFPTRPEFETTLPAEVSPRYIALLSRLRLRTDIRFLEAAEMGPLRKEDFIDFTHVDANGRRLVSERLRLLLERP